MQLCVSETCWNWNSLAGRTALLNTASHSGWDPYCCTTLLGFGAALDLLLTDDLRALPVGGCGYVCSLPPLTQRLVWVNSGFCKPFGLHGKHDLNPSHYNFWFLRQREVKKQKVTNLWFFCFLFLKIILQTAQVVSFSVLQSSTSVSCQWLSSQQLITKLSTTPYITLGRHDFKVCLKYWSACLRIGVYTDLFLSKNILC